MRGALRCCDCHCGCSGVGDGQSEVLRRTTPSSCCKPLSDHFSSEDPTFATVKGKQLDVCGSSIYNSQSGHHPNVHQGTTVGYYHSVVKTNEILKRATARMNLVHVKLSGKKKVTKDHITYYTTPLILNFYKEKFIETKVDCNSMKGYS